MHIWFARTALVHFGLDEHECLIGVQSGLACTDCDFNVVFNSVDVFYGGVSEYI